MNRPKHGGNLAWAAAIASCPASLIRDFSASINPLGPPSKAIAKIRENIDCLIAYPDPNYAQLKEALAHYHQIPAEYILPGNGSAELLTWAGWELSQKRVTYVITPAFGDYWRTLSAFNANWSTCQLNLVSLEQEQITTLSDTLPNQDFIAADSGLLLNNPHNPTGQIWTRKEILPYLAKFDLVVVDEAFMDFLPPEQEQSLISVVKDFPNLVILRSLTKFYSLPGLRIGYALANPARIKRWQKFRDPWSVNALAAIAAEMVIQDRQFQQQTWDWLPPTRNKLRQGLASIPGLQPFSSAANFLLVKTSESSTKLQEELLKQSQILIRDCLSFPELGDRYFRIAVRSQKDNSYLLAAILTLLAS
ncbi:MAG: threonine-phosphate decarboxylase CobD [Xenococcaceae cyanobacterium]